MGMRFGGRQKGTPNKVGQSAKESFLQVFDALGGVSNFRKWAEKNQDEFYKLYSKLIPTDITTGGDKISYTIALGVDKKDN